MEALNDWERTTLGMIREAAKANQPCPTNLDIEMELGCNSTSVAPTIIKRLEDKGLITVRRFQRFREVTITDSGDKTARSPDRQTTRPHVPRGKGASRPSNHTDRKLYRSRP